MASVIRVFAEHRIGGEHVHAHATWRRQSRGRTLALAAVAGCKLPTIGRDAIAHVHLSERGSFVREGALVALARRRGLTTAATIHGGDFLVFARRWPRLASAVLRRASLVTCLDHEVALLVRRLAPSARVELMPNPVEMDDGSPPADETAELVLFAGEISVKKGADVLVDAWRMIAPVRPSAKCIMVGPAAGFSVPEIERLTVRPAVGAREMRTLIRTARVVALPSRAEAMPMVLTEAMGGGRPFVSTPVGGVPDLARSGGVLVPVGDPRELAKRLGEFLADPSLARKVGERARSHCRHTRSLSVVDMRLRELYATVHAPPAI